LIEGMSAKVVLPTAKPKKSLIVPRDSVISMFGQSVVFTVNDSKAGMLPVNVIGYEGLSAGVEARGLQAGMQVVVEGNERLRNGQVVVVKKADVR
jgi:multidrug efflux pump subunit AcrA (membrane-fusion protein)